MIWRDRPQRGEPLNVILVEDDDADAKAIRRAFARSGAGGTIRRARDGVEALDLLHARSGTPPRHYILLVDLNMPRMSGLELLEQLRGDPVLHRAVAFVMTTSNAESDRDGAYERNVAGYILKENAGEDFMDLVHCVEAYRKIVELPDMPTTPPPASSGGALQ